MRARLAMLPPDDICEQEIYRAMSAADVCTKDATTLLTDGKWDLETYLARHVQVRCDGNDRWLLDYKLADLGHRRDISLFLFQTSMAPQTCVPTPTLCLRHQATLLFHRWR